MVEFLLLLPLATASAAPFLVGTQHVSSAGWLPPRGGHQAEETTIVQEEVVSVATEAATSTLLQDDEAPVALNDTSSSNATAAQEPSPYTFPLRQPGDGHEEEHGIPNRFIRMQKGNMHKAKHCFEETLKWRQEHDVDTILARPHPMFDVCKHIIPHFFAGRDPTNHVIFVQRIGFLDIDLGHRNNATTQDLLWHYCYVLEYCWNMIEPRPDQTMTSVLDLKHISLGKTRRLLGFAKQFVNMMSHHYPQRSYKTLLINAPRWFGTIYHIIAPLLRESTRKKIEILNGGKKQDEVLKACLGDAVPEELLSASDGTVSGSHHDAEMEQEMRNFVSI